MISIFQTSYRIKILIPGYVHFIEFLNSEHNKIRKHFAGIGYTYDKDKDVFYAPSPFPSWKLNSDYIWEAPSSYPNDGKKYTWDESKTSWVEME